MSQKLWDFGGSKKNMQHFRKPLSPMLMLRIVGEFYANFDHFFSSSWGSCQKCAINWASKDGTWLMKLIIIIIITLYGLGVTSRISSWLKKRRRKKKDRRLCVLMVVVLGDDIPFRQQQWSLSSRRDYQRSDLSCSFQCVYMVWAARRHSVWRSLI